jgi:hypothetical protein
MNFKGICDEIRRRLTDVSTDTTTTVKLAVNMCYLMDVWPIFNWWFARHRWTFDTVAPYETGTVSVTEDSNVVTGSGTTFTSAMVGRKIVIGSDTIAYKISAFTSATSITLETVYKGDTGSGKSYAIYQDIYQLNDRCLRLLEMWQTETPSKIYEWDEREFDELMPSPASEGVPTNYKLIENTSSPYYDTGTVAITNGQTAVVGTGTAWTSSMVGHLIKFEDDPIEYVIASVTDATHLTIDLEFQGTTLTEGWYEISPAGILQVQLYPLPDRIMQIQYKGIIRPLEMVGDTDEPDLPSNLHYLLVLGGYWRALPEKESSQPRQTAWQEFQTSLNEMKKWYQKTAEDANPTFKRNYRGYVMVNPNWWRLND